MAVRELDNPVIVTCGCGARARIRYYVHITSRDGKGGGRWLCDDTRWRYGAEVGWNCGQQDHAQKAEVVKENV